MATSNFDPLAYGATPVTGFDPAALGATPVATEAPKKDFLTRAEETLGSVFPGRQLGKAVGTSLYGLGRLAQGDIEGFKQGAQENRQNMTRVFGDVAASVALPASLVAGPVGGGLLRSTLGTAGQYGALGAATSGGQALSEGKGVPETLTQAAVGGAVSGALGGVFNLLGKGFAKASPSVASFTSGVPKEAIKQVAKEPGVAKQGLKMSVEQIRNKAVGSLNTLYKDLGEEFASSLDEITAKSGQTKSGVVYNQIGFLKGANQARRGLTEYARDFAREFRLGTKSSADGVVLNFDKSPIVKAGEKSNVQEVFRTISTWDDFSAKGLQDLAERVGALRNFESGAKTESSAIVSKIYNKIAGTGNTKNALIPKLYPELAKLRTNFAINRTVLDEVQDILNADKRNPVSIQSSITRLSNLYKTDKEGYLRIIKELSDRSGVDYLSLLAGTEVQKVLPNFIRGLGGGGALSVGASLINPYLLLLAPIFSPRLVGLGARNAPSVARTVSPLLRASTAQTIPQVFQGKTQE